MAENSGFWTTSGAPAGHQVVSYTQAHWSTAAGILAACSGFEGVAPGYLNELACSYISANHVHCDTGGALVDGKWYINDAVAGVTIPNAPGGTVRKDRIVLRCTWADFHTELTVLTGDASDYPTITQTSGTTYDILLYKAQVTDAGVVTLTDERTWASKVTTFRQGGSATIWSTPGTTNYLSSIGKIQCGTSTVTVTDGVGSLTVTFPVAYSYAPIAVATVDAVVTAGWSGQFNVSVLVTTSTLKLYVYQVDGTSETTNPEVYWIAIGPV